MAYGWRNRLRNGGLINIADYTNRDAINDMAKYLAK